VKKTLGTYTPDDVQRWLAVYMRTLSSLRRSIASGELNRGFELVDCARRQERVALSNVAIGHYDEALTSLASSAESWGLLLEKKNQQEDIEESLAVRSGDGLYLAAGSGSESAVQRVSSAYEKAFADSATLNSTVTYGMAVRSLCLRKLGEAAEWLARVERDETTESCARLLESIISEDETTFAGVILDSARYWRERVRSERLQRHPDAVCDLYGFTKIRLAERVWGRRPDVDLEAGQIPPELFDAQPESVDPVM
jgi:hypothetical protein